VNHTVRECRWRWRQLAALAAIAASALCLASCDGTQSAAGSDAAAGAPAAPEETGERPPLDQALANLKIPPAWFDSVELRVSPGLALQGARRRIAQYLESADPEDARRAVKLAYRYAESGELAQGHEYAMYLYFGREYAWALTEFQKKVTLEPQPGSQDHNALRARYRFLASCYRYFRAYDKAEQALLRALTVLPEPPNRDFAEAVVDTNLAGLYAEMGETEKARQYYDKAIAIYRGMADAGRLVGLFASGAEARLNAVDAPSLAEAALKDGRYMGTAPGYEGDVRVTLDVDRGRVKSIDVQHRESRQRGSVHVVPDRIVGAQSLQVDGVTGATITSNAVVGATFEALKRAGLE